MALYKLEKYNKRIKEYKEEEVNLSSDISFWVACQRQSYKDGIAVRWVSKPTRGSLSRKVVQVIVNFPDGEIWQYTMKGYS